jgi:hypothetical protein
MLGTTENLIDITDITLMSEGRSVHCTHIQLLIGLFLI